MNVNFIGLSNVANDPRRAEQLRIASQINLDEIEGGVIGPAGNCGFRSGIWVRAYQGVNYRFYASIPHESDFDTQIARIKEAAALHIAGVLSGYLAA